MIDNSGLCHCKGLDELMSSFYGKNLSGGEVVKSTSDKKHSMCIRLLFCERHFRKGII